MVSTLRRSGISARSGESGPLLCDGEGVWKDEAEAYAYASLAGLNQPGMSELVAGLSPSAIVAGKRRGAELATALSAKQAVKQAKDAVK